MEILYYVGIARGVSILIPKRRGVGYLKAPFGGHHCNDAYRAFTSEIQSDCFDIDGYLFVGTSYNWQSQEYRDFTSEVLQVLLEIYPHCSGAKEIGSDEFFKIIKN